LIQAYDEAIKLHTSLVNAPAHVLEALKQNETAPNTKKRQYYETSTPKAHASQIEEEEESGESDGEEQETAYSANYGMGNQFSAMPPYGYPPYAPPYGTFPGAGYNPWAGGFAAATPTKSPKPKKSTKLKTAALRVQSAAMEVTEDGTHSKAIEEGEERGDDQMDEQVRVPKAKRPKLSKDDSQTYTPHQSMYSPMGLHPPLMGDVPMGYQSGYPPQAPPTPNWWSQMSGPWSHPTPQNNPSPDNATLWAYYYYGYAMGQYDAINLLSKKRRPGQ
jgi:hypothetical protein